MEPDPRPRNLRELLEAQAEKFPNKTFLYFFDDARALSYAAVDCRVNQIANLFLRLRISKGQTISLLLPNIPEYVLCYFACLKIGAVASPLNIHLKSKEIEYILANSESRLLVTNQKYWPVVEPVRASVSNLQHLLLLDGTSSDTLNFPREVDKESRELAPIPLQSEDVAVMIYTSGTTGEPKGCLLTHGNFLSNAQEIASWLSFSEKDRLLCVMPLFHVNGIVVTMLTPLYLGGSMVLTEKFSTHRFWEIIDRYQVTSFGSVATMLSMLNQTHYPEGYLERLDKSGLRFALAGSAPVPPELMLQFEKKFHCLVVEGYGLSEATCRVTFNPPNHRRQPGSIGLPIGNTLRIVDENDVDVPVGQIGEILVQGANVMKGYFKNPQATAKALHNGWLHTGDLGYVDGDGFYYLVDRKSDMIIRGGENIYPREVDNLLYLYPKICEAATVGVPDELYGEEVKAFVVLKEGEIASEEEILTFCRERLADYKCPKSIEFLKEIPKGPTGKSLKRELMKR
ncbi:MAG: long-chain fatty acid--CoA ligase [Acidobacteria bacterium]|nr:MAG: long-chain fatty acid--CoA ligase [Acidobacteriota bacterium]